MPGIVPDWPVANAVRAFVTTRAGGVSAGAFGLVDGAAGGLNLGDHVGDDADAVRENRSRLEASLPGRVRWLRQVHGVAVHDADGPEPVEPPVADAAVTTTPGTVVAVMTADCLPILLADAQGRAVGVAHAGWRGLAAGVAETTVDALRARVGADARIQAWLGPAIGPTAFEVGDDVRQAFCDLDASAATAFLPGPAAGKWWADLFALARLRLASRGVTDVRGGALCTVTDAARFYSHRRDRSSGRLASLVWLAR
ncbi:MAG: peptidoglycan editing factor PgeF [Burkholderiales bacterium]|nr:MAG: peptidoglycan editing factor PgeF [Burkholderiales bacterium]